MLSAQIPKAFNQLGTAVKTKKSLGMNALTCEDVWFDKINYMEH